MASTPAVDAYCQTTMDLINTASSYAEGGVYDKDIDGMIRRLRVVTNALQSALNNIMISQPTPAGPPVAPVTPPEPEE